MKYINNKIIASTLIAASIMSCTDEYDCQLQVEKPQNAAINEYLAQFDLLKSYIDRSGTPFQLAVNVPGSEFAKKEIAFSTVFTNFDAVDMNGSYDPLNTLKEDGTYNFGGMQTAADVAAEAGVTLYGGVLCSNQGQRAAYYNKLIEPIDIPVEVQKGTTKLFNFENDAIGTTYPMTGNSSATVEEDPAGESGHVLHVGTNDVKAAYSYPKFHVVLPAGRKLGDYVRLNIDLRFVADHGIYGTGLRVFIQGQEFNLGKDEKGNVMNGATFCGGGDKWKREGTINLKDDTAPGLVVPESLGSLTEFDLAIGSASGGAQFYLDNISMDYEVSGKGTTVINFEGDNLNTVYPMVESGAGAAGGGAATVVEDPDGETGHVLYIDKAVHSFPEFTVKLADGKTLGDYTGMSMDMRLSNGEYGSGMFVKINGQLITLGQNADKYGFDEDKKWKRGGIFVTFVKEGTYTALGEAVPATTIEIPNVMKDLNEITFAIGSSSGNWTAYIDNLIFTWEAKPQHIEKTPEEKKEIFTKEMEKWIGGMVYAGVNETKSVKAWNIIGNPLDKTVNDNTFNWGEYLGEVDYARTAVKIARDTVKNANVDLELFVSNTFGQYDEMGNMADELISLVNAWEEDNVTKIDGYNILLNAIYSKDVVFQEGNKTMITNLFDKLGKTGKLIRVSDLSMMVEELDGNFIAINKLTEEDRAAAASYMAFIMQEYRRLIPADKQYGISISGITETNTGYKLCPWTSDYNRNEMYEGIVDGLK
ncbi:endo-1,4-beta-xylanase [Bacteroides sp. 1001136B_160425_E2]|uniref:endo-1,4-beta-xylanase n=1 Tax=Bacteroides sp. 1001136B_160425_E2 TaxID=2787083 RepID=UPI0018A0E0E4|nr:endo-1,4-beta-xylanase [Bacteroides sp. 1001136B_160425_E2]